MTFQITALPAEDFAPLFQMSDQALAARNAVRTTATGEDGLPCRVSLQDAEAGETVILLNHQHLDVATPYAGTHAIYVRRNAEQARLAPGKTPAHLDQRLLSLRAFGADDMMVTAEVIGGVRLRTELTRMFEDPGVAFIDIHSAKQGCFHARAVRA